jgi:hypothetical protein
MGHDVDQARRSVGLQRSLRRGLELRELDHGVLEGHRPSVSGRRDLDGRRRLTKGLLDLFVDQREGRLRRLREALAALVFAERFGRLPGLLAESEDLVAVNRLATGESPSRRLVVILRRRAMRFAAPGLASGALYRHSPTRAPSGAPTAASSAGGLSWRCCSW